MNELYQSPQTPETHNLHNSEVKLDMHAELYSPERLGIPAEENQYSFSVAGEVLLGGQDEPGTSIALIKALNKQFNRVDLYAVGLTHDSEGNKKITGHSWLEIKPGQKYNLGRKSPDETVASERRVTGERIFGEEFSNIVSRNHLDLELTMDGELTIQDHSTNGTKVIGHEVTEALTPITHAPNMSIEEQSSAPSADLVTHVPSSEEREQKRIEAEQRELSEVQRRISEITDEMGELTANFSENDKTAIWKYASGRIKKREAQEEGRGQESINQGMISGEGWNSMSQTAREVANNYLQLMSEKSRLIKRLK